jgi:rsbT co-antagonist protein RsbR
MQSRQQAINLGVMGLCSILGLFLIAEYIRSNNQVAAPAATAGVLVCIVLLVTYWRGFDAARYIFVTFVAILLGFSLPTEAVHIHPMVFVAPAIALVMASPTWVVASGVLCYSIIVIRGNFQTNYATPIEILYLCLIVGILTLSRLATDNAQRLVEANTRAEQERLRAEEALTKSQQQADELLQQNTEQQRLLQLVNDLEIPTINVANGVLLAPIVGSIDAIRAERLARRLLEAVSRQNAQLVILDIAGATAIDDTVVDGLVRTAQAIRLLGCQVTLTGIAPQVAITLSNQNIALSNITVARSPGEVLANQSAMEQ